MKNKLMALWLGLALVLAVDPPALADPYGWAHRGPSPALHRVYHDRHDDWGPRGPYMHGRPGWAGPHHVPEWGHWQRGHWSYSRYRGHLGWWWIVDGSWFLYPERVYPYPDYETRPVVIVEPNAPAVVVEQQPVVGQTVIIQQPPAMPAQQTSPTYTDAAGRTCREYQSTIIVGGVSKPAYGTACLQPDGTWHVVK